MSHDPNVLRSLCGYLVADTRGRLVGRVEDTRDGAGGMQLTVRGRLPWRRRKVVPETAIEEIDTTSRVIALSVEREALRSS